MPNLSEREFADKYDLSPTGRGQLHEDWDNLAFRSFLLSFRGKKARDVVRHLATFGPASIDRIILGGKAKKDLEAVSWIIRWGDLDLLPGAVRAGADINKVRYDCRYDFEARSAKTMLLAAVIDGNEPLVRELVAMGADLHPDVGSKLSPLDIAALDGDDGMVDCLLELGADPNGSPGALKYALGEGNYDMLRNLLNHGAAPNQKLHWSSEELQELESVREELDHEISL